MANYICIHNLKIFYIDTDQFFFLWSTILITYILLIWVDEYPYRLYANRMLIKNIL